MAPNTWPGWENVKLLGEGSFGCVYEIRKEEFGQEYHSALKVIEIPYKEDDSSGLINDASGNKEALNRYYYEQVQEILREVQLMASLQGVSNIVSYEDHQIIPKTDSVGYYFLIRMELLTPLRSYMASVPISDSLIVKLGSDICRALEYCEKNNILHRDIKPANIFISRHGDFKLGDFGIARCMADANTLMTQRGTARYMAPEVFRGGHYGFQVDIYSLGLVLYQYMNENRPPFCAPNETSYFAVQKAMGKRLQGDVIPPPVHGSDALKKAVLRAVEFSPEKRYSSAADFRKALESALNAVPVVNAAAGTGEKFIAKTENNTVSFSDKRNLGAEKKVLIRKLVPVLGIACMLGISFFVLRSTLLRSGKTESSEVAASIFSDISLPLPDSLESTSSESTGSGNTASKATGSGGWIVEQKPDDTNSVAEAPDSKGSDPSGGDSNSSDSGSTWSTSSVAGNSRTNKEPSARIYTLKIPDTVSVDIKVDGKSSIKEHSDTFLLIKLGNNDLHKLSFSLGNNVGIDQEKAELLYENLQEFLADDTELPGFQKYNLYTDTVGDFTVYTWCFSYIVVEDSKYPIYEAVAMSFADISDKAGLQINATSCYEDGESVDEYFQTVYGDVINAFKNLTVSD